MLLIHIPMDEAQVAEIDEARARLPVKPSRSEFVRTAIKEFLKNFCISSPRPTSRKGVKDDLNSLALQTSGEKDGGAHKTHPTASKTTHNGGDSN